MKKTSGVMRSKTKGVQKECGPNALPVRSHKPESKMPVLKDLRRRKII